MRFRPCIDIHNGKVKQIVGSSLKDQDDQAIDNFVAAADAAWFARMYEKDGLSGGHIILLNPPSSDHYEATRDQAIKALQAAPGQLQIGGGINPDNAAAWLDAGASHLIVTSYVFKDGRIHMDRLEQMRQAAGKEHLVLDLSCRRIRKADSVSCRIVTDRWQKISDAELTPKLLDMLSDYCDEFLVHAVDVEGKSRGIEENVAKLLGDWAKKPVTYAGGVSSFSDLDKLRILGRNQIDVTIGSALDIFGGHMPYKDVIAYMKEVS